MGINDIERAKALLHLDGHGKCGIIDDENYLSIVREGTVYCQILAVNCLTRKRPLESTTARLLELFPTRHNAVMLSILKFIAAHCEDEKDGRPLTDEESRNFEKTVELLILLARDEIPGREGQLSCPAVETDVHDFMDPEMPKVKSFFGSSYDWPIVAHALRLLPQMTRDSKEAARAIGKNIDHVNTTIRRVALEAMVCMEKRLHPYDLSAIAFKSTRHGDPKLRRAALKAISAPDHPELLRPLEQMLDESPNPDLVDCIGRFKGAASHLAPVFLKLTESKDPKMRGSAARALGSIGAADESSLNRLISMLDDENWEVRQYARLGLESLDEKAIAAFDTLLKLAEANDKEKRIACFMIFRSMKNAGSMDETDPLLKKAIPVLIKGLGSGDEEEREAAAETLGHIGVVSDEVLAALKEAQSKHNSETIESAIRMLENYKSIRGKK